MKFRVRVYITLLSENVCVVTCRDVIEAKHRIKNRIQSLSGGTQKGDVKSEGDEQSEGSERHRPAVCGDATDCTVRLEGPVSPIQRTLTSHTHSAPAIVDHARQVADTRAPSMLMRKLKRRVRKQAIEEEAREALDYLNQDFNMSWWVRVMKCMKITGCGFGFGVTEKALKFTQSRNKLLGELLASHLRMNPFLRGLNVRFRPSSVHGRGR